MLKQVVEVLGSVLGRSSYKILVGNAEERRLLAKSV
jgi:hypothetical protein